MLRESSIRDVPFMDLARQHGPLAADLRAAFERVLGSSGFILGEEVERFEHEFAGYCGARHCVGVASGTAALTIMIQAAGIGRGDEVIVPAQTFIASALAVIHAGARPVYVDVERGSGLLDPTAVEAAVGPATTAILAVHLYGQACAMDPLRELADRRGLLLLEDAAQAHGATYRGIRAGNLGRAAAFSFYPSKSLGALGDGGAITTNDADLARRARALRDLGRGDSSIHTVAGYNERLDGLQAALLRAKLPHVDAWNAARREAARRYRARLEDIELLEESPASPCIYHLFPVRVADRDALAAELGTAGIATGVHYPSSVPDQPAMRDGLSGSFPVAAEWAATELSLPIFPGITEDELTFVSSRVNYWTTGRAHHDGRAGDDLLNTAEPARAGWGSGGGWS